MMSMSCVRYFGTGRSVLGAAAAVEKSVLAKLRKSTGYSFSKCKEALVKHENDLKQAEEWLRSQAKAHGWEKATKLQGRATMQGLVSVLFNNTSAVMMEMNCETDFVARNKKFQSLVQRTTQGIMQFSNHQEGSGLVSQMSLSPDDIGNIHLQKDSSPIKDEVAIAIGELGENLNIRRAISIKTDGSISIAGYTHPAMEGSMASIDHVQFGKYGAIITYRSNDSNLSNTAKLELGRQICQHIIGMDPKEIGNMDEPPPERKEKTSFIDADIEKFESGSEEEPKKEEAQKENEAVASEETEESVLINQDFLLDPDITIREFLVQNSLEVLDFVRFECGQNLDN